jgi:hypothetical protein
MTRPAAGSTRDTMLGLAQVFIDFADQEARGVSPLYERLADEVAARPTLLALLAEAPPAQQRATLFFAAVRDRVLELGIGFPADGAALAAFCADERPALLQRIAHRRTQTNEVARSAQLVPALAAIEARCGSPVSVLELGASAGLNLRFDDYRYRYQTDHGVINVGRDDAVVVITCSFDGDAEAIPATLPRIVDRLGLDLEPIDPRDPVGSRWLRACVWADERKRDSQLVAALGRARADPPNVVRGDAATDLVHVASGIRSDVPLVIFHQALMAYLSTDQRLRVQRAIHELARKRPVFWLMSEGPSTFQALVGLSPPTENVARHALVVTDLTGAEPRSVQLASADPHGRDLRWLAPVDLVSRSSWLR